MAAGVLYMLTYIGFRRLHHVTLLKLKLARAQVEAVNNNDNEHLACHPLASVGSRGA